MPLATLKNTSLWLVCLLLSISPVFAQTPTTNPVAAYYSADAGYPAWTDNIKWETVINMGSYTNGANHFRQFENARDQLYAQGGGVLYYPAGTYDFSDAPADGPAGRGLMLKKGVVIRGATPTGDADARDGTLSLPTKFVFKFNARAGGQVPRDWNLIGIMPAGAEQLKDVHTVGIAWVHVVGATVYFGPQLNWGATYGTAGSWYSSQVKDSWKSRVPDGTHPIDPFAGGGTTYAGVGTGRLVFGCLFEDAAVMNDALDFGFGATGFYTYKFGARIGVYGKNVFIANNSVPKSAKNFKYVQKTCDTDQATGCTKGCLSVGNATVIFDYGKNAGIDVNKELIGRTGFGSAGYYETGVIVQDNFVYNHGHKGFNVSGKWVTVRNNRNERDYLKESADIYGLGTGWRLTLDGYIRSTAGGPGCISDNLSRAFDVGGQAVWIHNNTFNNVGSDLGNDGEGILCQSHGGTEIFSWAITGNTHTRGTGEGSYIGGYDVDQYGSLIAWNTTSGWVGSTKAGANDDAAFVSNQAAGGTRTTGTDVLTACPAGSLAAPSGITATPVPAGGYVKITWTDATSQEIGFRIDRKVSSGAWTPIAFRPRKSTGTSYNEQVWYDFHAPRGKNLTYRVAAINCNNDDSGASAPAAAVSLGSVSAPAALTLSPAADAYVRSGTYGSTNYGTAPELLLKKSSGDYSRETYLTFDLSAVNGSIAAATLRLYGKIADANATNLPAAVYPVAATGWSESTLTWNTKPASSATALATTTIANNTAAWYEWDVTAYLQAEKAAGRNMVSLALKNTATSTPYTTFNAMEATGNPPQLVVTTSAAARTGDAATETGIPGDESVLLFPNPVTDILQVAFTVTRAQPVKMFLVNSDSRRVISVVKQAAAGYNRVTLPVNALKGGVYLLTLLKDNRRTVKKVVLIR